MADGLYSIAKLQIRFAKLRSTLTFPTDTCKLLNCPFCCWLLYRARTSVNELGYATQYSYSALGSESDEGPDALGAAARPHKLSATKILWRSSVLRVLPKTRLRAQTAPKPAGSARRCRLAMRQRNVMVIAAA